ncbi:hypothetical protein [Streptomyces sp. NPDC054834]
MGGGRPGPDRLAGPGPPRSRPGGPRRPAAPQPRAAGPHCDDHLARRLTRDGEPLISEEIRQVITGRSHGLPLYLDLSVMRFLEIHRTGRSPAPADFDHDFPALIARTLSDLTAPERHVLRSVSLLDAFDLPLAARAAGLTHEAPALRLIERPFVRQDPFGLWPFHLHGLIRSTVRDADDHADDRWSPRDWHQAAQRAGRTVDRRHQPRPPAPRGLPASGSRHRPGLRPRPRLAH